MGIKNLQNDRRRCLILLFLLVFALKTTAQSPDSLAIIANKIVDEATKMYKSEMASWYGTDLLSEKYADKRSLLGGYFSYSDKGTDKCVFFSKAATPKVLLTVSFNGVYSVAKGEADATERDLTPKEKDYFAIRQATMKELSTDTLFEHYKNTDLNLIPIIDGDSRKVYILTGPQQSGVVLFGNDYVLTFDKNNKLLNKRKIHKSLISIDYTGAEVQVGGVHSHLPSTGDFITSTDICTLLMYGKTAKWSTHYVMSEKFVSIWDIEKKALVILTKEVWEKIGADQEKRKKKKN